MGRRARTRNSPVGIALAAAGLILAFSPEARRSVSRLLLKGTTAMFGAGSQSRGRAEVTLKSGGESAPSGVRSRRTEMSPEEERAAGEIAQMLGEDVSAIESGHRQLEQLH